MVGVFCNTGNEYPNIVKFVRSFDNIEIIKPKMHISDVIEKYGFPLISKEVSQGLRQLKTTKSDRLKDIRLRGSDPLNGKTIGPIGFQTKSGRQAKRAAEVLQPRGPKRPFHNTATGRLILKLAGQSTRTCAWGGCNSLHKVNKGQHPLGVYGAIRRSAQCAKILISQDTYVCTIGPAYPERMPLPAGFAQ